MAPACCACFNHCDRERDRLDLFEENVESALELFRDEDGDERLDASEAQSPLASGG